MKPSEVKAAKGPVLQFPVAFGAITVSYNLSGVKSGLKLDGTTLADIFLGKIKTWNDPAIKALNPGMSLPEHGDHGRAPLRLVGHDAGLHHVPVGLQPGVDGRGRASRQGRQVADRHRRARATPASPRRSSRRPARSATSSRPTRCRTGSRTRRSRTASGKYIAADARRPPRPRPRGSRSRRTWRSRRSTRPTRPRTRSPRRRS